MSVTVSTTGSNSITSTATSGSSISLNSSSTSVSVSSPSSSSITITNKGPKGDVGATGATGATGAAGAAGTTPSTFIGEVGFNFNDDIGTSKVYMPIVNSQSEQSSGVGDDTSRFASCNLKVLSVNMRLPGGTPWNPASDATITIGVEKLTIGTSHFSSGNWSSVETESLLVAADKDFSSLHFTFDNAAISVGELYSITIQSDVDPGGTTNWYFTAVIEYDWDTRYTGASAIHES